MNSDPPTLKSVALFPTLHHHSLSCVPVSLLPDSSDSELELSAVRHQPEGLDQLQAQTKFTKKELQSLYRGFKNVSISWVVVGKEGHSHSLYL